MTSVFSRSQKGGDHHMRGCKSNQSFEPGDLASSTHIVLCIRVHNDNWYEVVSERILSSSEAAHQAEQLYDRYFPKLKNQFFHLKTPVPRAIRCSAIDEMAVVYR